MSFSTFLRGRPTGRGLAWLALSDTAYILAGSVSSDGGGGGTTVWGTAGTAACRVYPLATSGVSRFVGGAVSENSTHMIRMPVDATVNLKDRVVVSGRGTFEVLMVPERTDQLTRVVEVIELG